MGPEYSRCFSDYFNSYANVPGPYIKREYDEDLAGMDVALCNHYTFFVFL